MLSTPAWGVMGSHGRWAHFRGRKRTYFRTIATIPLCPMARRGRRKAQSDPAIAQSWPSSTLMAQAKAQLPPRAARRRRRGRLVVRRRRHRRAVLLVLFYAPPRRGFRGGSMAMTPGLRSAQSRFRVGMTFPVDPSPFVLAAGMTKVKPPEEGGMISVEAVGLVNDGGVALHRLYLPGGEAFFMLHLGRDGAPDECRYFTLLDRVTPASRDEWAFWLDPAEGMIGWPQFETKDGKTYDRVWAPAARGCRRASRSRPYRTTGTIERKIQAMLYGAHTGAAPAPAVEYVLVCAVEQGDETWVECMPVSTSIPPH
jgi:hypothetical protein